MYGEKVVLAMLCQEFNEPDEETWKTAVAKSIRYLSHAGDRHGTA